jgi:hypothetical protein
VRTFAPLTQRDPEKPPVRPMVDEYSAAGALYANARRTGFTRVTALDISTKNLLMSMVLTDLANLNQKKITKDSKVQNSFQIVTALKLKCALTKHTTTLKRVCQLSARTISKISKQGTSLLEKT